MKILFVSTEFEEPVRGITSIIKAMITAAKDAGHEVGVLAGYPRTSLKDSELLDSKVEHIYLQHYLATGKKDLYPRNLRSRRTLLQIAAGRDYLKASEIRVRHDLVVHDSSLAHKLDYIIKVPYAYYFFNHGLSNVPKRVLKRAIRKYGVDLVITGAPMEITKHDVAPAKLVQFVHDTMPIDLLETPADNQTPQKFARQLYAAAAGADMVLANSEDTAKKVHEVNPDATVRVVYGTATNKGSLFTDTSYLERKRLDKDNYLLFIGVIENRKNVQNLLDAYMKAYSRLHMPLVLVGPKGFGYKDIMAHYHDMPPEVREHIIFTGFISEADKYALLNNARAFVLPSIYEGIGIPVVEAFGSRLPVLTSRRGALPEAGGDAAFYVDDPYNVGEISDALVRIATDEKLRTRLQAHMQEQIDKFTPEQFNRRFKQALDELSR